jgi:hypothetical protein
MKKLLFLLVAVPLLAFGAKESGVQRFDKANEGAYFGDRDRINPSSRELREISKSQGMPSLTNKKGFPVLPRNAPTFAESTGAAVLPASPAASAASAPPVVSAGPAPSYRTLGDAAKAGVDPLNLVKPSASKATVPGDDGKSDLYYYVGGILGFILLGGLGFLLSLRTPRLREN